MCIGLIMAANLGSQSLPPMPDQTYLVHGWSRGCGPTMAVCSLCSTEISSSEKSVSMVMCTKVTKRL